MHIEEFYRLFNSGFENYIIWQGVKNSTKQASAASRVCPYHKRQGRRTQCAVGLYGKHRQGEQSEPNHKNERVTAGTANKLAVTVNQAEQVRTHEYIA